MRNIEPSIVLSNGFRNRVTEQGLLNDDELNAIDAQVADAIEAAVDFAANSPFPDASEVTTDVYVDYQGGDMMSEERTMTLGLAIREALHQEMERDASVIIMGEDIVGGARIR